jgi:hypothetical protein
MSTRRVRILIAFIMAWWSFLASPGGLVRIASILGQPKRLPTKDDSADPIYLILGYEDDGYSDNGYWGREGDDGTGDQCRGLGNAYVIVTIQ